MVATDAFVGREFELDLAREALRAAREDQPRILWIEGEPGIGKTALVRRFLNTSHDVVALEASGEESETALNFGVVRQLIARDPAASACEALGRRLARQPSPSPLWVGSELVAMLGVLQKRAPVVVALDDAHWSDQPSAVALQFALRRLYADRVLMLVVSRPPPEGPERLGPGWMRLLGDSRHTTRVRLSGLGGEEVRALAESLGFPPLTRAGATRLRDHTAGHPLYLRTLLAEIPPDALAVDHGPLPAPRSLASAVLAGVAKLSPAAQELIAAAAVAGAWCQLEQAARAARVSEPLAVLAQALDADLLKLEPHRTPPQVSFSHPLVRAAVYDDLSPARRRTLHLAWAAQTSGSVALAHRVAASPGADDELAAELVATARAEVDSGALTAGIEHLLLASRVASSAPAQEAALLRAVDLLGLAGDVPRAHSLRGAVLACSDSPHRSFVLATLSASAGRLAEAEAALREVVVDAPPSLDGDLLGQATASLSIVCAYAGRGGDAIAWASTALAEHGHRATVAVTARQAQALGLALVGRAGDAIATLSSLSSLRVRPEPFEAELLATRGRLKIWHGNLPGAVEDLSAVIRWARDGVPLRSLPNAYGSLAEAEHWLGRWEEGLAHAEVAVSLAQDADQVWELPFVHAVAVLLHAGRGEETPAAEHEAAAHRAAQAAPLPLGVLYACLASAEVARTAGDWEAVLEALAAVRDRAPGQVAAGLGQRACELLAAEAMLHTGRLGEARRAADALDRSLLGEDRHSPIAVEAHRLRGALEHVRGRPTQARAAFLAGRELAAAAGSRPAAARLELEYGRHLRRLGRRRAAVTALREARAGLESLRARPLVEQCDVELASCGAPTPGRSAVHDYGLTAREQVVAELVCSGHSNREVAAELYLSTKAIEYHLANIFAKLDIRSRHQIADRLQQGASGPDRQSGATARARAS